MPWTPAPTECPDERKHPHCEAGFAPYEGWKELGSDETCIYYCSAVQAAGHRYRGTGSDFTPDPTSRSGSIDCTGCAA